MLLGTFNLFNYKHNRHETNHIMSKEHMESKNINRSIPINTSLNFLGDQIILADAWGPV